MAELGQELRDGVEVIEGDRADCDPGRSRRWELVVRHDSRSTFLSNLPTLVLGICSMKITSSGSHHFATRRSKMSMISCRVS